MAMLLLIAFVVFAIIGVPIGISLVMTAFTYFAAQNEMFYVQIIAPRLFGGISSFELLAIPMFILSGDLLFEGKISKSLVDLANALVGHIRGSMAIVTTVACMFFGAVSGSGPATAAAVGSVVAPEMEKSGGYDKAFTAAVITASGPLGILIPPSILMVVYGVVTSTSIGALLIAGIGPGLVFAAFLVAYEWWVCKRRGYGHVDTRFSIANVIAAAKRAIWALLIPVIILGGIYSGLFTPTEAAGVSVLYALFVGLFVLRTLNHRNLFGILLGSSMTTATVMLVVGGVSCLSWVLTREQIPEMLTEMALHTVSSPMTFMLICNVILLFAGMIENGSACILLLTPLMFPISQQYGIDPVYFGAITVANLAIGMMTPPVATTLYVAAKVVNIPFSRLVPQVIPFCFVLLAALAVLMLFPAITMTLPNLLFGGKF
ncbi:MAG: TRAP transporter large permease [Candidatus Accumulibacter sp.]|jgi:C4-dicarboxylate transporter DctM subunit|nr:TRAP transporter large permease [Accumulibacter sp.]